MLNHQNILTACAEVVSAAFPSITTETQQLVQGASRPLAFLHIDEWSIDEAAVGGILRIDATLAIDVILTDNVQTFAAADELVAVGLAVGSLFVGGCVAVDDYTIHCGAVKTGDVMSDAVRVLVDISWMDEAPSYHSPAVVDLFERLALDAGVE